jgi:hypothetical protein
MLVLYHFRQLAAKTPPGAGGIQDFRRVGDWKAAYGRGNRAPPPRPKISDAPPGVAGGSWETKHRVRH